MNETIKKIKRFTDKDYRFVRLAHLGLYNGLDDKEYLERMFKAKYGWKMNLNNPKTLNEKLQWIKLYDRKQIYTTMVDKYEAKGYVSSIIGPEYIIPTIGVWESAEYIDFDTLPKQFVLKCTHDSHGVVICRDKTKLNISETKAKLEKALKNNYYLRYREWPYKDVKPRVIAEKYMQEEGSDGPIKDYKIYTFNGKAYMCMINQDRGRDTRADYFDKDFNWLDFTWGYKHASNRPEKPRNYDLMFLLAEKLAQNTIELRVDLYEICGRVYFGELTFFDGSGFDKIIPIEWDYKLGNMLELPSKIKEE